ncbi:uncharacterized protein LOC6737829 isoform X1 [Drosophila simulans]|uniref:GD12716 n=1 Tax=Drosophila simulans TaxID=7240 RepID=B4QRB2_DROSI|nr:uncharacterized protein LOC6737829 isoform X1 [Drosophila simulans]EDX10242.1 GD12716 [Drosophila simulans]KMY99237.1 uncharacterized protein Dsimw501_GD12716, isoform A [Drosophila simulans]
MNKLRALLPGQHSGSNGASRHSVTLEPEIGFQITIDNPKNSDQSKGSTAVPELNVHLIAARHLPSLFGFKIVQGYLIKVKLFPGSKRLDSSIQTNTWPKFNENFKFPLVPDIKSSMKHVARRPANGQVNSSDQEPEQLFSGQFVVFTVYALLELPATNFNRFNKTYRSLKDRSTSFVQRFVDPTAPSEAKTEAGGKPSDQGKGKKKSSESSARDAMPPLTISESRRNIGSVTCYLESKLFQRNSRTGCYSTEELWLPIKDITTTVAKSSPSNNNLVNSTKGVVELALEVRDLLECEAPVDTLLPPAAPTNTPTTPNPPTPPATNATNNWQRMTAEVKRKMGISNAGSSDSGRYLLRVTTTRMRCSNKVKDELEATASSGVYVKTTAFEHGIYIDAWKSPIFFPSLSTKWDDGSGEGTIDIPLQRLDQLEAIVLRITLATKKMGKKLVLGTVIVGGDQAGDTGSEQMRLIQESPPGQRVAAWHCYH